MKALQVEAKEKLELREVAKPVAGPGEVIVRVAFCGICGSDMPRFFDGAVHATPQILGHEFSGDVVEAGPGVDDACLGSRVVVVPFSPCGSCSPCRSGHPQLCDHYGFIGSHEPGAMAEYVVVPEGNLIPVPEKVSMRDAALVEPFTVALHSVERLPPLAGETALVLGAGPIGLMVVAALRARGVGRIVVSDLSERRLDFALAHGADVALNPSTDDLVSYFADKSAPALVYETAGHPVTQVQAITLAAKAGRVVYVGTSHRDVTFKPAEFEQIFRKELLITGNMMSYGAPFPGAAWGTALDWMDRGIIDLGSMVTGIYRLEDGAQAFYDLRNQELGNIKVVYEIGGEL